MAAFVFMASGDTTKVDEKDRERMDKPHERRKWETRVGRVWEGVYDLKHSGAGMRESDSIPIGSGDAAANVWVANDGTMIFLLAKNDAWSENGRLLKLGEVRLRLRPSMLLANMRARLHVNNATIVVKLDSGITIQSWFDMTGGGLLVQVWDPSSQTEVELTLHTWRSKRRPFEAGEEGSASGANCRPRFIYPDVVADDENDAIVWFHRNENRSIYRELLENEALSNIPEARDAPDPLLNRTFGGIISGKSSVAGEGRKSVSFKKTSRITLESSVKSSYHEMRAFFHTATTRSPQEWVDRVVSLRAKGEEAEAGSISFANDRWWRHFWLRSWIQLCTDAEHAANRCPEEKFAVERGFVLERLLHALSSRGMFPIKFNGNLFTVKGDKYDPDYRQWGGMYWFQNTRLPYWGMMASGDGELMQPFFDMYWKSCRLHRTRVKTWFGHNGSYIPETMHWWGAYGDGDYGCSRERRPSWMIQSSYIRHYYTPSLELAVMACDWYKHTKRDQFLKDVLLPLSDDILTFFEQHFPTDLNGIFVLSPSQSLETYQNAINPLPDLAGLRSLIQELLQIPHQSISDEKREWWENLLSKVPDLPIMPVPDETCSVRNYQVDFSLNDDAGQYSMLAPAEAWSPVTRNYENPALYAVFPFRLFQMGKDPPPSLSFNVALQAYARRPFPCNRGWCQDAVHAAHLGLAHDAMKLVVQRFMSTSLFFPAFWTMYFDYTPEVDTGAVAKLALQSMLVQYDGDSIMLFPAWPREWPVSFRLHAPAETVVEASCVDGVVEHLVVDPPHRIADITFPGSCA
ncbi:hypothetical protein GUITHDRAFT_102649 [Guillardia theta CCMP2712]|uniref:DUF5703 domain-containing protein n=1 Tax=Guillardia theta (strain CCMP2712) TaxID=905079 RepID=L1JSW2_GUITC|nr:hypothetical protein GUITHDRAFT_102649 [Guillardia theta CCMP2712]EKX51379.1 hypothetical protein GUITHDRAFT_102649 [Guillardia theta CCMP2712]|eukprot:XP_005838359.1 hypothetical protein GUITHDRAFT_102649 [Guillardia theta CCMP2712]